MFSRFDGRLIKGDCSNLDGNRLARESREAFAQFVMHCIRSDWVVGPTEQGSGNTSTGSRFTHRVSGKLFNSTGADMVDVIEPDMDAANVPVE